MDHASTAACIALAITRVAFPDVFEAFFVDHVERLGEAPEVLDRRRAAEDPVVRIGISSSRPIPIRSAEIGSLVGLPGLGSDPHHAEARWHHQALLTAGHRDVHTPRVHLEEFAPQRGHAVGHQQGRVVGVVHGTTHRGDVVAH